MGMAIQHLRTCQANWGYGSLHPLFFRTRTLKEAGVGVGYIWVYVLLAVMLTLLAMGTLSYSAVFRPQRK